LNDYLAKFLGFYVSEGHCRKTRKTSDVYLAARDKKMQKLMIESIEKGLHLKPTITWRGIGISAQIVYYLTRYVFKAGILAENKEVPWMIFSAPAEQKWKFLEGYFLGDGYGGKERVVFTTISRKLACGLIFLLRQLGIKKITLREDNCYRINVYESLPFFKIKNKKSRRSYYDLLPSAYCSAEEYKKYGSYYKNCKNSRGASRIQKSISDIGFDYIKSMEAVKKPEYVYDLSVKKTERFIGGTGLITLHNSVAEEGLDVPSVDLVVFYEPIPSAVRTIQRRGRTGRNEQGKVIMLIAKNTRDEGYRWSSFHKEKRMHRLLGELKNKLVLDGLKSENLDKSVPKDEIKIICDDREKSNGVVKQLVELGVKIDLKRLDIGDYQPSERCIVELKTIPDFVDSIIDGRLLEQLKYLAKFDRPVLILEGIEDIYSQRNIHPNAIKGMLSTIAVSYGIPIIQTKNNKETAELLYIIAKREQDPEKKHFNVHGSKKPISDRELQEYIVSSLPNVGPAMAKELLHQFRNVRKIFNANEEELKKVPNIGEKTAKEIQRTLDKDYYL
jgi:ERCC4-type nuclease